MFLIPLVSRSEASSACLSSRVDNRQKVTGKRVLLQPWGAHTSAEMTRGLAKSGMEAASLLALQIGASGLQAGGGSAGTAPSGSQLGTAGQAGGQRPEPHWGPEAQTGLGASRRNFSCGPGQPAHRVPTRVTWSHVTLICPSGMGMREVETESAVNDNLSQLCSRLWLHGNHFNWGK